MSKKQVKAKEVEVDEDQVEGADAEGAEAETEAKGPGRKIMITVKGKEIARADYIRDRWTNGKASRGAIAKELTKLQGKPVPYQIVFAATKGIAGGPDKEVEADVEGDDAE